MSLGVEDAMKKLILLFATVLALAIAAGAQGIINFGDMPDMASPSPMPNGYANFVWTGFYYVDPFQWNGAGPGFKHQEWMKGPDVVFAPYLCGGNSGCYASLSYSPGFAPVPPPMGFHLVSATAAAGYGKGVLVVTAYLNGKYVGSQRYFMTTQVQQLDFPTEWGVVTQVVFQGSVVLYDVTAFGSR